MDLISKTIIIVVILVAIIFAVYYLGSSGVFQTSQISQSGATTLVYHDLQNSFQNADINILNVTPSQYSGSWQITAAVIENATSPCPDYSVYSFDYPKYGFVYQTENVYTQNCVVYENSSGKGNIIGSDPAAITKSYNLNLSIVNTYVQKYGFSNITVNATYFQKFQYAGVIYANIWRINYTTRATNNSVEILMYENNGSLIKAFNTE